ncbi:MAG: WbqC-like protein [Pseudomonas sp.]|nr:WbqC-like protein [Pseudomonas sp.]
MMQPYLFPYLGYFQLIAAADVFVLGDDLQYIRSGWVNRNRILCNGEAKLVTFPLKRDRHDLAINQRQVSESFDEDMERLLITIKRCYIKAPYFNQVMPLLERLLRFPVRNLALFIEHSIREICAYLHIDTPILRGSDMDIETPTDKQDRVLKIVKTFAGDRYLNPVGGIELYDADHFARHGVALRFFKMDPIEYWQFKHAFVGNLSIIDVLMFNCVDRVQELLPHYSVCTAVEHEQPERIMAVG